MALEQKLVDLLPNFPAIWDSTATEYSDRDKKKLAWQQLAAILDTEEANVQTKYKTLKPLSGKYDHLSQTMSKCVDADTVFAK
jgi:hypothetical protein